MKNKATLILSTIVLIVLIILAGGLLFLKSDYAAERMRTTLQEILQESLGVEVAITSCYVELLPPTVRLEKVKISGRENSRFFAVEQLRVELDSLSLLAGRFQIDLLRVESPQVTLNLKNGSLVNIPALPVSDSKKEKNGSNQVLLQRLEVDKAKLEVVLDEIGTVRLEDLRATLLMKSQDRMELLAELEKGSFQIADDSQQMPHMETFRIRALLNQDDLDIQHVSFHIGSLETLARGNIILGSNGPDPRLSVNIKSPMYMLNRFLPSVPQMNGFAKIDVGVFKKDDTFVLSGKVKVDGFGIEYAKNIDVTTDFQFDFERLEIDSLVAESDAGIVSGKAYLRLNKLLSFGGSLKLKDVHLGNALRMADITFSPVRLQGDGEVAFDGNFMSRKGAHVKTNLNLGLKELVVQLAEGEDAVFSKTIGRVIATGIFTGRSVKIPAFNMTINESPLAGEGEISFLDGSVVGRIESERLGLRDVSPVAGLDLDGLCRLTFHAGRTVFAPKLELVTEIDGLEVNDRFVGALRGSWLYVDGRLTLQRMLVARHGGVVRLMGSLDADPPHALQGNVILDGASLPEVFALVQGSAEPTFLEGQLTGRMEAFGNLDSLGLKFQVAFHDVKVGNQLFEEGGVIGRLSNGAWHFELVEARMGPGWIFAQGEISKDLLLDLQAYSTGLKAASFQTMAGFLDYLDFRLDLQVTVKGPVRSPSFSGWTKIYDTRLKNKKLPDSFLSAKVIAKSFEVDGHIMGETSKLSAKVQLEADLPFESTFDFKLKRLGEYLTVVYPDLKSKAVLVGSLVARGHILKPRSIVGQLRIEEFGAAASTLGLLADKPMVVNLEDGGFEIQQCELVGVDTRLTIAGGGLFFDRVASTQEMRAGPRIQLDGQVRLDGFPPFFDFLSRSVGRADVKLSMQGSWSEPTFSGEARFSLNQLRFIGFGDDFEDVTGNLDLQPGYLKFSNLRGRMGGGRFGGEGLFNMTGFSPSKAVLDFEVDKVRYDVVDNLWGIATGTLGLNWKLGQLWTLTGDVRVQEGEYRESNRLVPVGDDIFRPRVAKVRTYNVERELLAFDLRVQVPGRFRAVYNMDIINFDAEMQGNLRLTGTNERLGLIGELESLQGTVSYLASDFRLDSAQVRFVEEYSVHPQVDVLASLIKTVDRGIRGGERGGKTDFRIELHFSSDGDNIRPVELKSDPWLEKHDIVAILHFGFTTQDIEGFKGKDMWEPILRYIEPTTEVLLKKMFPFPPEVIQPTHLRVRSRMLTSDQLGTVSPRVEIGAKLNVISSDLEVGYGRSLYNDLDQDLELTYKLSEGVSTRFRWEEQQGTPAELGDIGLDLKLHWEW